MALAQVRGGRRTGVPPQREDLGAHAQAMPAQGVLQQVSLRAPAPSRLCCPCSLTSGAPRPTSGDVWEDLGQRGGDAGIEGQQGQRAGRHLCRQRPHQPLACSLVLCQDTAGEQRHSTSKEKGSRSALAQQHQGGGQAPPPRSAPAAVPGPSSQHASSCRHQGPSHLAIAEVHS